MERSSRIRTALKALAHGSGIELVERVELAAWTTFRVGGLAHLLIRCLSTQGVVDTVRILAEEGSSWVVLGAGSNVVLPDQGVQVPVITLAGELSAWEVDVDGMVAGAGANLTQVIRAAIRSGLDGLVELFGIPGSVGGAVVMNAGAYGVEVFDRLDWVEVVDREGNVEILDVAQLDHGYRWSALGERHLVVTRVRFSLRPGNLGDMNRRLREINAQRRSKLPGEFSAGSLFKNPEGDFAGRLLEEAGCKGLTVGGARVSEEHANVVVTSRGAKAADILALAREMRKRVLETSGVDMEPEVRFLDPWGEKVSL